MRSAHWFPIQHKLFTAQCIVHTAHCMLSVLQNAHYTLNTVVAYTLHSVAKKCASACNRLCLPPENLALSWLSHSASILTHLNESVSRSSVPARPLYLQLHLLRKPLSTSSIILIITRLRLFEDMRHWAKCSLLFVCLCKICIRKEVDPSIN